MPVNLVAYRELSPLFEIEDQENDLYLARHNSIIDILASDVDRTLDRAEYDLPTLVKGLAFEASFCHIVSGNLAIRGVAPHIPFWQNTIQYQASTESCDPLRHFIDVSRREAYLTGSQGVDVRMSDGNFAMETRRWLLRIGERRGPAADWFSPDGDQSVLNGAVAQAGQAADVYLRLERYKDATRRGRRAQSASEIEHIRQLLGQTRFVRQTAEKLRDQLAALVEQHEQYLLAVYLSLYPEAQQNGTTTLEGACARMMEDIKRVIAATSRDLPSE